MSIRLTTSYNVDFMSNGSDIDNVIKQIIEAINTKIKSNVLTKHQFCSVKIKYNHKLINERCIVLIKMDRFYSIQSLVKSIFYIPTNGIAQIVGLSNNEISKIINDIIEIHSTNKLLTAVPFDKLSEIK